MRMLTRVCLFVRRARRLPLTYHDYDRGKVRKRGQIGISVEIVPGEEAKERPVGYGRTEPNTDPYLPPPSGRLQFSYNPLAICKELIGPDTVIKLICCCLCVLCLVAIAFGGMYYTSFYTMYESMF